MWRGVERCGEVWREGERHGGEGRTGEKSGVERNVLKGVQEALQYRYQVSNISVMFASA